MRKVIGAAVDVMNHILVWNKASAAVFFRFYTHLTFLEGFCTMKVSKTSSGERYLFHPGTVYRTVNPEVRRYPGKTGVLKETV